MKEEYNNQQPLVAIHCFTYNHQKYIKNAIKGFVIQKTKFPFTTIIVDDASTDHESIILWNFANNELDLSSMQQYENDDYIRVIAKHKINHKCTFDILFLKYNHYHKKDKTIYLNEHHDTSKYIAICEGDDYWTDPQKLQKQVDFLEGHSDYTMTCHRVKCFSESDQKFIREDYCYEKSQDIRVKDIIYRTGLFIPTCSIIYRKEVKDNYPDYCTKCLVGDYPLQIMCAMKGKTYYFNDLMGVYRVNNNNSWMGKQVWRKFSKERVEVIRSQLNMFKGFAKDYPQWEKQFHNKEVDHILRFMPSKIGVSQEDYKKYVEEFVEEINKFTLLEKLDMKIRMCNNQYVKSLYRKIYLKQFHTKKKYI